MGRGERGESGGERGEGVGAGRRGGRRRRSGERASTSCRPTGAARRGASHYIKTYYVTDLAPPPQAARGSNHTPGPRHGATVEPSPLARRRGVAIQPLTPSLALPLPSPHSRRLYIFSTTSIPNSSSPFRMVRAVRSQRRRRLWRRGSLGARSTWHCSKNVE
jgi:hypothetical protein